ncbi:MULTISPECIES: DUF1444 family protein [unclassified Pseudoalteromonas]|uniref:DUF1444 family protein n=1 Tax=unclassified Pseudoalteromonas TaxID=194690 RepID=UPI0020975297|nr:DUF1444 family protein [Pseudoalteromonas sp. XMcav2-N]MCO7191231.1 DUF1444 family protein [Pseudoalteromonas sp. XMcav2-N]
MNKILIMVVAFFLSASVFSTESLLSERAFTENFIKHIKKNGSKRDYEFESELKIRAKDDKSGEHIIYMGNAYDTYRSGHKTLEQVYTSYSAALNNQLTALKNTEVQTIMPVIKPIDYLEGVKRQLKEAGYEGEALPFFYQQLNEDLIRLFAFDSEDSMRFVSPDDVKRHDIEATISDIAGQNMRRYFESFDTGVQKLDTEGEGDVYVFVADDNYEASVLTVFDHLQSTLNLKGEPIIFVPARNIVIIADITELAAVQKAHMIALGVYSEYSYTISPHGYVYQGGEWIRITPDLSKE